ncbi:recombinase RecT [Bacillus sp. JJ722]|uniref:recombinase RecT n=1 Tax=Bacillus sp. JJ722 TaxID=3122973 RepID=UPI002FFFB0AD
MSNQNQLAMVKKDTVDVVAHKVREFQEKGEIHFPTNYSPENAMKSAWLTLQNTVDRNKKPALDVCTKDSIANSLLDMVVQGLNPAKKQGYFIVYGNQLTFQRSYFGTMAVTKSLTGARDIDASVIYDGDEVDYEIVNGRIEHLKHKQKFGNINKEKIMGAYCVITLKDERTYTELMTMDEIRQAWKKSQMWGKDQTEERKGSTHDEFKQEMAKKTVINRACKKFLNSSDDSSLVLQHFNRADDAVDEAQLSEELEQNANKEIIDVEFEEVKEQPMNQPQEEPLQKTGTDGPGW